MHTQSKPKRPVNQDHFQDLSSVRASILRLAILLAVLITSTVFIGGFIFAYFCIAMVFDQQQFMAIIPLYLGTVSIAYGGNRFIEFLCRIYRHLGNERLSIPPDKTAS